MRRKFPEAAIALADGSIFTGRCLSERVLLNAKAVGEVVFNTSMYGYQEILTDPSYSGQIMTFTYPHIGNVGCNEQDIESASVHVEGVVVRNVSLIPSNFRSTISFDEYLKSNGTPLLFDVDTRSLVKHIRSAGAQMAAMGTLSNGSTDELIAKAKAAGSMAGKDLVQFVSCKKSYVWSQLPWEASTNSYQEYTDGAVGRPHVIAIDCGIKYNILRNLLASGFRVTVVPATMSADELLGLSPDAVFISNGPGDPATLGYVVSTVSALLGRLPIFGICLGHQILAQALGGKTYKLKFGHRGGNHPVKDLTTGKVEITVQNHGFAVDGDSLPEDVKISHLNLNDQTVEGLIAPNKNAFSVQYHPEASSGPRDSQYLFERFFKLVVGDYSLSSASC
jgi:carbamoyl-phosphate synthase small subunit